MDPTNFTDAQKRALESIRRLEEQASRSARRMREESGEQIVSFFRTVEAPISGLRRHFERLVTSVNEPTDAMRNLADQARRTGEVATASAAVAAGGMRALGVAGLTAFATYEVLRKSIEATGNLAQRVFGTGVGAAIAGMPIQEFSAISQALYRFNVPQEQTQGTLGQWRRWQIQARAGDPQAATALANWQTVLARYGVMGVNLWRDSPEEIMDKLAVAFRSMTPEQAQAAGQAMNLTPQQIYGLRQAGAELPTLTNVERARSMTTEQFEASQKLINAENNLSNAWNNLYRAIMLSGLADNLTRFSNWLATVIGGRGPGGQTRTEAIATVARGALGWKAPPAVGGGFGAPPSPGETPLDNRTVFRALWDWLTGATPATPSQAPAETTPSVDGNTPLSQSLQQMGGPGPLADYIIRHEGGSPRGVANNPGNIKYAGLPGQINSGVRATDGGIFASYATPEDGKQAIATQIQRAASGTSSAYGRAPTLESFLRTYSGGGYGAGRLATSGGIQSYQHGGIVPILAHAGEAVLPTNLTTLLVNAARGGGAGASSVTNRGGDVHVGQITVHAPVRDARTIADAVYERIQRVSLATQANTGLE